MPNWCHNTLWVLGSKADLEAFAVKSRTDEQPLTFEADAPIGEWDWHRANCCWGTKWDAHFDDDRVAFGVDPDESLAALGVTVTDSALIYKFDTAWSPPSSWLLAAMDQNPTLELILRWGEVGDDSAGEYRATNGALASTRLPIADVLAESEMWF